MQAGSLRSREQGTQTFDLCAQRSFTPLMMPEGLPRQRVKNPLGAQAAGPCSKLPQSAAGRPRSPVGTSRMLVLPKFSVSLVAGVRLLMNQAESLILTYSQSEKVKVRAVLDLILVSYRGDGVGEASPFFPLPLPWPPCCPPCWPYCPPCGGGA